LIDIADLRANNAKYIAGYSRRGSPSSASFVAWFMSCEEARRKLQYTVESLKASINESNQLFGELMKSKNRVANLEARLGVALRTCGTKRTALVEPLMSLRQTFIARYGAMRADNMFRAVIDSDPEVNARVLKEDDKISSVHAVELTRAIEDARVSSDANADSKVIEAFRVFARAELTKFSTLVKTLDHFQREVDTPILAELRLLPNPPDPDVPDGRSSEDNREIARHGAIPEFAFAPKPHWDLHAGMEGADPDAAGAMSGSGFALLLGPAARLERALGQFLLDLASGEHGYREVSPPLLMRDAAMDSVTIASKFRDDMYRTSEAQGDGLYLIPTAEHPLTNLHRDQVLDAARLPLRYTALTPCFRREAGAAGRDTRGLLRVHQFWKVEMMSFVHPDRSAEEHERMRGNAEAALARLGLPFRTVFVCTGDMSAANRRQYDLEVWAPGVGKWLEVSSVSNFGDWQARRCGTRCKEGKEKPRFVHTLNGSALGMPRTLIALLENNQRADGSVAVPEALRKYLGGLEVLGPGAAR
jgi:seryl-tRNA synthetase